MHDKPAPPKNATREQQREYNQKYGRNAGQPSTLANRKGPIPPAPFRKDPAPQDGPVPDYTPGDETAPVQGADLALVVDKQKHTIGEMDSALQKSLEDNRQLTETHALIVAERDRFKGAAETLAHEVKTLMDFMQDKAPSKIRADRSIVDNAVAWMGELMKANHDQAAQIKAHAETIGDMTQKQGNGAIVQTVKP